MKFFDRQSECGVKDTMPFTDRHCQLPDYAATNTCCDEKSGPVRMSIIPKDLESSPNASKTNLHLDEGYSTSISRHQQVAVLFVGFVSTFQVAGFTQAYGVFQSFHSDKMGTHEALLPDSHASQRGVLALIGTLSSTSSAHLLGPIMAHILDRARQRTTMSFKWSEVTVMMTTGALLLGLGYGLAAMSTKLWQLVLTQGIMAGTGGALLWYPAQAIGPEYFRGKRATAFGIMSSGAGLGALFYAPVTHELMVFLGIRKTLVTYAITNLLIGLLLAGIMPPPRPTIAKRRFLPGWVLHTPTLYVLVVGGLVFHMCLGTPGIFGPGFARTLGLSAKTAAIWLASMNGVGAPSRLVVGYAGDRWGRLAMSTTGTVVAGVAVFGFWMPAGLMGNVPCFWIFTVLYGMMAASFAQFVTPLALDIYGPEVYNSVIGVVNLARGIGSVVSGPIGGTILGIRKGKMEERSQEYTWLIVYTGACLWLTVAAQVLIWHRTRSSKLRETR